VYGTYVSRRPTAFQGRFRLASYLALSRLASIWMNCEHSEGAYVHEAAKPRFGNYCPDLGLRGGAGDGNRTRTISLGICTIRACHLA